MLALRRGKPDMDDILLAFDKSLEAIGRLDPDRTLFRACRVCLLRLPDSAPAQAPETEPPGAAPAPAATLQVDANPHPAPAAGKGNSRNGWDGRVLRADGSVPLCTSAVADAATASAAAERAALAGWIAERLSNDVSSAIHWLVRDRSMLVGFKVKKHAEKGACRVPKPGPHAVVPVAVFFLGGAS